MWDYNPPPLLHLIVYVSLDLIPYVDDLLNCWGHDWRDDTLVGCVHWEWNFPHLFMLQGEHGTLSGYYITSLVSLWREPYDWLMSFGGASHMGGVILWITILEGDSFHMDDSLEDGASNGDEGSLYFANLSLQFLDDKKHLGGEDCNIPKLACS